MMYSAEWVPFPDDKDLRIRMHVEYAIQQATQQTKVLPQLFSSQEPLRITS